MRLSLPLGLAQGSPIFPSGCEGKLEVALESRQGLCRGAASTFTFIKSLFSSSSLSAIRVVSSAYLRLLIFFPALSIPACASSSLLKQLPSTPATAKGHFPCATVCKTTQSLPVPPLGQCCQLALDREILPIKQNLRRKPMIQNQYK